MKRTLEPLLVIGVSFSLSPVCLAQSAPARPEATGGQAPPRAVSAEQAPRAAGPYSQAIIADGFLFASGQLPVDPKTGDLVTGGFEPSLERVLDNLEAVLKSEGLSFADVVKTTVYLTKADDFAAMNAVYARRMGDAKPARTSIVVAGLPKGSPVEIDLIARTRR